MLNNFFFFTNENQFYLHIFGCTMGSPVSAFIPNLVVQFDEDKALLTACLCFHPKWWYRFVNDRHSCSQKQDAQRFLTHFNSINPHIQFTMEVKENACLLFLDMLRKCENNCKAVEVYQKPTHTNKYLDFNSCHQKQHKQSIVKTL